MKYLFAPGCALVLCKPHLVEKLQAFLESHYGSMKQLLTYCRYTPEIASDTVIINVCPGCDRRYREDYVVSLTVSLWELLSESEAFPFPDYKSQNMTIIDACPTRDKNQIRRSVRVLADRMNISIIEPTMAKKNGSCCGDSFYGKLPTEKVVDRMKAKASEMPIDDILVYCVSCSQSVFIGGRRPRYLVDLLFSENTVPKKCDPDQWHGELDEFIESHKDYEVRLARSRD